jgi:hypothetical protein
MKRTIAAEFLMFVAGLALVTGAAACASSKTGQTATNKASMASGTVLHTGKQRKDGQVSLLARAFLPSSAKAHSGFAYYGYLVFTDSSPASAFARRTASKFYLGMLAQVNAAREGAGIHRENMAVLYLPLKDGAATEALIKEQDAQGVVASYDYARAHAISAQLKRAGKTVPGVAIIGSTRPLTSGETPDATDIVDLTDPGTVAERMEHFRDALETRERLGHEDGQALVLKRLRAYFAWAEQARQEGPTQLTF